MLNPFCAKFASVNRATVVFILAGSSPQVYAGLSPGEHHLKVVPRSYQRVWYKKTCNK